MGCSGSARKSGWERLWNRLHDTLLDLIAPAPRISLDICNSAELGRDQTDITGVNGSVETRDDRLVDLSLGLDFKPQQTLFVECNLFCGAADFHHKAHNDRSSSAIQVSQP